MIKIFEKTPSFNSKLLLAILVSFIIGFSAILITQRSIKIVFVVIGVLIIFWFTLKRPIVFVFLAILTNFLRTFFIPGLSVGQFGVAPYMMFETLAIMGYGYQIISGRRQLILPIGWKFLFAYFAFSTISLFFVLNFRIVAGVYVRTVLDWFLLFLIIQIIVDRYTFNKLIWVILVQSLILTIWGIFAGMAIKEIKLAGLIFFWNQFQKNDFAAYLAVASVLALSTLLVGKRHRQKWLSLILLPLIPVAWLFTYSRAGFLAIIVSVGTFLVLERNKQLLKKLLGWLLIFSIISSIGIALSPAITKNLAFDGLRSLVGEKTTTQRHTDTIEFRIVLLKAAAKELSQNPLFGLGFNQWQYYSPFQTRVFDQQTGEYREVGMAIHNKYLGMATNQGLLALFSYWGFVLLVLITAFQVRRSADLYLRTYLHAFIGALVGTQLAMQFAPDMLWEWPVLAILVGIVNLIQIENKKGIPRTRRLQFKKP